MSPASAALTHAALLRAVNLGPHNKISMRDLQALATDLGLQGARTLLQSGNLVFGAGRLPAARLEATLEREAAKRLALSTDFFVRTASEWRAIVAANPFPAEAEADPAHLVLVCLKSAPPRGAGTALQKAIAGREVARVHGREAYITYPDGIGTSKLTIKVIERALGTSGTARNWNTVLKIGALLDAG